MLHRRVHQNNRSVGQKIVNSAECTQRSHARNVRQANGGRCSDRVACCFARPASHAFSRCRPSSRRYQTEAFGCRWTAPVPGDNTFVERVRRSVKCEEIDSTRAIDALPGIAWHPDHHPVGKAALLHDRHFSGTGDSLRFQPPGSPSRSRFSDSTSACIDT